MNEHTLHDINTRFHVDVFWRDLDYNEQCNVSPTARAANNVYITDCKM